ncbi:MAG: hypothetical protein FWG03_07010 [Clostridiales bacterium]|nr:hypothetical protein [Clostridiales bacterium]
MKRLIKSPVVNAVFISLFTAFYTWAFLVLPGKSGFGGDFLAAGRHHYIAWAMIAVTILVVILLVTSRRPYDEYQTAVLNNCLLVAVVLVLVAIAVFFVMVLNEPSGIVEKFTLFIAIHWTTVVFADLAYVLLCRRG